MNSVVFTVAARAILPLMLLLSLVELLRGHNEPGGGFIGGLLAASGFAVYALACGGEASRRMLIVRPQMLIGAGLLTAAGSGLPAMIVGRPFMTGMWTQFPLAGFPEEIKIGTPVFFDIGVYLTVMGVTLLMVFSLEEAQR